jgi:hypothetical protein
MACAQARHTSDGGIATCGYASLSEGHPRVPATALHDSPSCTQNYQENLGDADVRVRYYLQEKSVNAHGFARRNRMLPVTTIHARLDDANYSRMKLEDSGYLRYSYVVSI